MLSNYQLQIIDNHNFSIDKKKKIIPNPGSNRKYKLHYQFFYLSLGLQIKNKTKY